MSTVKYSAKTIREQLETRTVESIRNLIQILGCSSSTFYRLMDEIDYYTSYNHHRRYITLRDTPEFDQHGIWEYNGVRFSKWKTVPDTIVHIVNESEMGLAVYELSEMLKIRVNNQLQRLRKKDQIVRKRHGRNQIYYSADDLIRHQQIQRRHARTAPEEPEEEEISQWQMLQIITVLLEHSKISCEALSEMLCAKGVKIRKALIGSLFQRSEIEK